MNTTSLDIYNLLVDAGIDAEKAKPLAKEILSRDDAAKTLATKKDISGLKDQLKGVVMWVAGLLVGQIAINTAITTTVLKLYLG